jgi:dihydrofolate reductase
VTRVSIIVAMANRHVMGRGGRLPWRLSADLKRFKALTMGHHLIMGRKTFESIGRPLPGRTSIVLTRQPVPEPAQKFGASDVLTAASLDEALRQAQGDDEVFVVGGAEIYALALPRVERLYVTWVDADVEGDTFFPELDCREWRLVSEEPHSADANNEHPTRFAVYDRITDR